MGGGTLEERGEGGLGLHPGSRLVSPRMTAPSGSSIGLSKTQTGLLQGFSEVQERQRVAGSSSHDLQIKGQGWGWS
jgi:hypothetical protein